MLSSKSTGKRVPRSCKTRRIYKYWVIKEFQQVRKKLCLPNTIALAKGGKSSVCLHRFLWICQRSLWSFLKSLYLFQTTIWSRERGEERSISEVHCSHCITLQIHLFKQIKPLPSANMLNKNIQSELPTVTIVKKKTFIICPQPPFWLTRLQCIEKNIT